jgi:hypothetical protein
MRAEAMSDNKGSAERSLSLVLFVGLDYMSQHERNYDNQRHSEQPQDNGHCRLHFSIGLPTPAPAMKFQTFELAPGSLRLAL